MISVPWNMSRATRAAASWRASGQRSAVRSRSWRADFEHGRIERLLHGAGGFQAQDFEGGGGIFAG